MHILLDINMALHYKRVDQINWPLFSGARQVVFVILVFIRELEKNKAHNPSKLRLCGSLCCFCPKEVLGTSFPELTRKPSLFINKLFCGRHDNTYFTLKK